MKIITPSYTIVRPCALVRVCATCGNGINVDEERENGGLKK